MPLETKRFASGDSEFENWSPQIRHVEFKGGRVVEWFETTKGVRVEREKMYRFSIGMEDSNYRTHIDVRVISMEAMVYSADPSGFSAIELWVESPALDKRGNQIKNKDGKPKYKYYRYAFGDEELGRRHGDGVVLDIESI